MSSPTHNYDERAQRNRPTDPQALAAEVRRLNREGLSARDVSVALRISITVVLEALRR